MALFVVPSLNDLKVFSPISDDAQNVADVGDARFDDGRFSRIVVYRQKAMQEEKQERARSNKQGHNAHR